MKDEIPNTGNMSEQKEYWFGCQETQAKENSKVLYSVNKNIIAGNKQIDENKTVNMNLKTGLSLVFSIKTVLVTEPSNEVPLATEVAVSTGKQGTIISGYAYSKATSSVRGAKTMRVDEGPETIV